MKSFAEVALLDEARLRVLLRGDSSTHRVWAAWALGMRDGRAMEEEARARIQKEPNPGVRRSLAVMLARDPDAMRALALDDPNEFVRVTAWRLISQVASQQEQAMLAQRLMSAAQTDASADVSEACLELLVPLAPFLKSEDVLRCLLHDDIAVCVAATELLMAMQAQEALAIWALHRDAEELKRIGVRLIEAGFATLWMRTLATHPELDPESSRRALELLPYDTDMTWEDTLWLASRPDLFGPEFILERYPQPTKKTLAFFLSLAQQGVEAFLRSEEISYPSERALVHLTFFGEYNPKGGLHERDAIEALLRTLDEPRFNDAVIRDDPHIDEAAHTFASLRSALRSLIDPT